MANRAQLSTGSYNKNDTLYAQQLLNKAGNYGLVEDGIYGTKTDAAVRAFQKANNLTADGILGKNTWAALNNAVNPTTPKTTKTTTAMPAVTTPPKSYRYDSENDPVYRAAKQKVQEVEDQKPVLQGTYDEQVEQLYQELMGRDEFSYDLNGDPLWQQYKDQYTTQGKLAMMDTMGQAAALTGGYGSSYAQSAGQQAYQGHLQQLNEQVPTLYQLAMQKYNSDKALLEDKFATAKGMKDDEYGRWRDEYGDWQTERGFAREDENTAWNRGNSAFATEQNLIRTDENTAYNQQQDAYNKLVTLIAGTGYNPTQEELAAAGMSTTQANALLGQYESEQAAGAATKYNLGSTTVDDIIDNCSQYQEDGNNNDLANYLDGLVLSGAISVEYADQLYEQYRTKNTVDSGNTDVPIASGLTREDLLKIEKQRTSNPFSNGTSLSSILNRTFK